MIGVLNKCDLPRMLDLPTEFHCLNQLQISANSGYGIETLKEKIRSVFLNKGFIDNREFIAISRVRHRDALTSADIALQRFIDGFAVDMDLELLALDLREALTAIGAVTGQVTNDEVLDRIFSSFCIGK